MVRILGNTLPNNKKIYIALTSIYGIGVSTSKKLLSEINLNPDIRVGALSDKNISNLRDILEKSDLKIEGDLQRLIASNIRKLIDIGCFRGRRHSRGLPTRGQRTRTNNRTCRKLAKYITISKSRKISKSKKK